MRLRLIAVVILVATVLGGAWVGRDLIDSGSGGGWSHEAGEAFDAERVLFSTFERGRSNLTFLVQARIGDVDGPEVESAVLDFIDRLEQRPDVSQIESYWSLGRPEWMRSQDGMLALIHAKVGRTSETYANRAASLTPLLRTVDDAVRISMGGEVVVHRDIQGAMQGTVVPIAIAALLSLALVFLALRNPVALGLVATTSVLSVALTLLGLYGLAQVREIPVAAVVLGVISAWGLASASGYLMLARYMAERASGAGPREAVVATVSTAGRTVAIAAAVAAATGIALWVLPTSLLRSTAYALGLAGLTAGVSAIIVLGLLLAVVGVDVLPRGAAPMRSSRLDPVTKVVQAHPVAFGVLLVVVLSPLLWTSLGMRVSEPSAVTLAPDDSSRQVAQQITANFPSNDADAAFVVSPSVVDFSTSDQLTAEYAAALSRIDGVARVDSDQGSFVAGAVVEVPNAVISRYIGDQRTWLQAPVEGFGAGTAAERVYEQVTEVMAPFRVLIGGTAARQVATADAVTARTPIFAGIVVLLVIVLMAWLLRSVSAAIRGGIVIVLMTAIGGAVMQNGFAEGRLRTLLSFSSDGSVAAVGPPIAWVMSIGIVAASSIFAWGAIREVFDHTKDAATAAPRALVATRNEHLVASALLVLPLLPLFVNGWRTAKLVGVAVVATGVAMMTLGRFVALPVATSIAPAGLWPVNRDGEVRRVYPSTPASAALVVRAQELEAATDAAAAQEEAGRLTAESQARAIEDELAPHVAADLDDVAVEDVVVESDDESFESEPEPVQQTVDSEPEVVAPTAEVRGQPVEVAAAAASFEAAEVAKVPAVAAVAEVTPEVAVDAPEPVAVEHVEVALDAELTSEVSAEADTAAAETPQEVVEPAAEDEPEVAPAAVDATDGAPEALVGSKASDEDAVVAAQVDELDADTVAEAAAPVIEAAAAVEPDFEVEAAAVEPDVEVEAAVEVLEGGVPAAPREEPAPGTVDVASLTESVIAAIEPSTPFTTELNSAYVANPANNLSRVMEAILRDASSRGGEEVLVYGHASRNRYRWMVVDSGPEAEKDASRARTLAEAQRFIRRVGGVVECRPEGDFTVFVVEIPMAS